MTRGLKGVGDRDASSLDNGTPLDKMSNTRFTINIFDYETGKVVGIMSIKKDEYGWWINTDIIHLNNRLDRKKVNLYRNLNNPNAIPHAFYNKPYNFASDVRY